MQKRFQNLDYLKNVYINDVLESTNVETETETR